MEKAVETKEEKLARAKLMYEMTKQKGITAALPAIDKLIASIEADEI